MTTNRNGALSSRTQELIEEGPQPATVDNAQTLRLVGSPDVEDHRPHRVQWTEDTVDNEHMNLKKSKICCIFHPNKAFDESSEEEEEDYSSSSSSSSSSDSESDSEADEDCCNHKHVHRRHRTNAYERKPRTVR